MPAAPTPAWSTLGTIRAKVAEVIHPGVPGALAMGDQVASLAADVFRAHGVELADSPAAVHGALAMLQVLLVEATKTPDPEWTTEQRGADDPEAQMVTWPCPTAAAAGVQAPNGEVPGR